MKKTRIFVIIGVIFAILLRISTIIIVNRENVIPVMAGWLSEFPIDFMGLGEETGNEPFDEVSVEPGHTIIPLHQILTVQEYLRLNPDDDITWVSTALETVSVGKYGEIYGVSEGTCDVLAVLPDGKTLTGVTVNVLEERDGGDLAGIYVLRIREFEVDSQFSDIFQQEMESSRPGDFDKIIPKLTWISGNPAIAQVSQEGTVTFLVAGPVDLYAQDEEGNSLHHISLVSYIGATIPAEGVEAVQKDRAISMNHSQRFSVRYDPVYATQKGVTWSSDNEEIAVVDEKGNVTGLKEGSCSITATSSINPQLTADFNVRIVVMPTASVTFTRNRTEVERGGTKQPKYTLLPQIGSFQTPVFETSDPSVATVSEDGTISGVTNGVCVITARAVDDASLSTEIEVHVVDKSYIPDDGMRIVVYMGSQSVGVYEDGEIIKEFICSTGVPGMDTPIGTFRVLYKGTWMYFKNALCYVKYGLVFHGNYVLHTIPYKEARNDGMYVSSYLKLGRVASHGCVRFTAADCRWLYNNVDIGTEIIITHDWGPTVAAPKYPSLGGDIQGLGWDPTDPDPQNPYNR